MGRSKFHSIMSAIIIALMLFTISGTSTAAKKKSTYTPPVPSPTPVTTPGKQILGYTTYYYAGDKSSYNSMVTYSSCINEIATATHITDGYGNITGLVPSEQITFANTNSKPPLVLLGNNFDSSIAKTLLESSSNRKTLISNLINIIKANGYKGVNIDIEGVYYYDRSYYTTFLSEVYSALKPLGYIVSASIPAKTSDNPTNSWNGAYDYASISGYPHV